MKPIDDAPITYSEPFAVVDIGKGDNLTPQPREALHTRIRKSPHLRRFFSFLLRIDVLWGIVFFLFLMSVVLLTTWITQAKVLKELHASWHDVFNSRLAVVNRKIHLVARVAVDMTRGFQALQGVAAIEYGSESVLSKLCSVLVAYDIHGIINTFTTSSFEQLEATTCMHGMGRGVPLEQLVGYVSSNHTVNASYYVDSTTYRFVRPLRPALVWAENMRNISKIIEDNVQTLPIFKSVSTFYDDDDHLHQIDWRTAWRPAPTVPHLIAFDMPYGILMKGSTHLPRSSALDYVQVRINATRLLANSGATYDDAVSMAIFINASLTDEDPLIMSNNWGQQSVFDDEIYTPLMKNSVRYLHASAVQCPLMREALRHVDLAKLQHDGYDVSVDFRYRGGPATVNARMFTTRFGFAVPQVYVSAAADITGGYDRLMNVCTGVLAITVVSFTALFWYFAHTAFAAPLSRMTELLLASLQSGKRRLYDDSKYGVLRATEVRQLIEAHNSMMRHLQSIDQFIPENVRHPTEHEPTYSTLNECASALLVEGGEEMQQGSTRALRSQVLSVVYVTMRVPGGPAAAAAARRSSLPALSVGDVAGRPPHLVEVVESAAHAIAAVHSGPFGSPEALSAFAAAVHAISHRCRGVVHQLTPESCTVHFGAAVEGLINSCGDAATAAPLSMPVTAGGPPLTPEQRVYEQYARCDARSAVTFALALQEWVDAANANADDILVLPANADCPRMPDVRVLVDTSVFTCGHYRALSSEHTMTVAFGRDVHRDVNHVPALIGVRVAITAETACRVRVRYNAAVGSSGIRQIPVEALCIGRVGLAEGVVLLFEVLPGPVAGDATWRRYSYQCFEGFTLMLRGNYERALCAFRLVADISDLEQGLMPSSLLREAATSTAVGGAVSVQVQRLMRECERRVRVRDTRPYCRGRRVPLGVDTVLRGHAVVSETDPEDSTSSRTFTSRTEPPRTPSRRAAGRCGAVLPLRPRRIVSLMTCRGVVKSVVAVYTKHLRDNTGLVWRVSRRQAYLTPDELWEHRCLVLGSAGALASLKVVVLRDIPLNVQHAICDLPLGSLDDATSRRVPAMTSTLQQRRLVDAVFKMTQQVQHPNLIPPIGYTFSMEGAVGVIKEHCPGGTLQEVIHRYSELRPITVARFSWYLTSALRYLHRRNYVHGLLFPSNISVAADGRCRLHSHVAYFSVAVELFAIPRTIYVSPAMAAGHAPTPACDMFCYALLSLAMLSRGKVWKWAVVQEGEPQPAEEELQSLLQKVEQPFFDAVAEGRLVPDTDVLESPVMLLNENRRRAGATLRRLLSCDPEQSPSADTVHRQNSYMLASNGLKLDEEVH